jgi:hypothetical protein
MTKHYIENAKHSSKNKRADALRTIEHQIDLILQTISVNLLSKISIIP